VHITFSFSALLCSVLRSVKPYDGGAPLLLIRQILAVEVGGQAVQEGVPSYCKAQAGVLC
jgi:hypothetical protein